MEKDSGYIFGPVPSRRLGLSLGVDLIPHKTCSFDCIYCQVGKTTDKRTENKDFYEPLEILSQLRKRLGERHPDTITLAGSGEPTLHKGLKEIINGIKKITDIPLALLTNGSLFWRQEVIDAALGADIILPTLSAGTEGTFRRIHRPHPEITLAKVLEGLGRLRNSFSGKILLEVMLVKGVNDQDHEIEALRDAITQVAPDRIQLNTVVRPPSESYATGLDSERLEQIRRFFGDNAEIIASPAPGDSPRKSSILERDLVEMMRRRPVTAQDISSVTGESLEKINQLVEELLSRRVIEERLHEGRLYYTVK